MDGQNEQAREFERNRRRLQAVAYRMLGSVSEAEDAVQEAWLRLSRADGDEIGNVPGWLTTVVGRVCIDMLRARSARREDYVGAWLPEPIVNLDPQLEPEPEAVLADSVGLALLVVLETLAPAERLAYVLHDMFGVPFEEIAPIVERSPAATRKLASRARARVRGPASEPDADLHRQREIVAAFRDASLNGNFEALIELLDPDVVLRSDAPLIPARVDGAEEVAKLALLRGPQFQPLARPAIVNGAPGLVIGDPAQPAGVVAFTVVDGRIAEIDLVTDSAKLGAIR